MSSPALETFLAALYTDAGLRERFLQDPESTALHAGLSQEEAGMLDDIDRVGLQMAANSYARKREQRRRRGKFKSFLLTVWRKIRDRF
jgi:hypothetical protein